MPAQQRSNTSWGSKWKTAKKPPGTMSKIQKVHQLVWKSENSQLEENCEDGKMIFLFNWVIEVWFRFPGLKKGHIWRKNLQDWCIFIISLSISWISWEQSIGWTNHPEKHTTISEFPRSICETQKRQRISGPSEVKLITSGSIAV